MEDQATAGGQASMMDQMVSFPHHPPPHAPGNGGQHQGQAQTSQDRPGPVALPRQQDGVGTGVAAGEFTLAGLEAFLHRQRPVVFQGVGSQFGHQGLPDHRDPCAAQNRQHLPQKVQIAAQALKRIGSNGHDAKPSADMIESFSQGAVCQNPRFSATNTLFPGRGASGKIKVRTRAAIVIHPGPPAHAQGPPLTGGGALVRVCACPFPSLCERWRFSWATAARRSPASNS
jgi:hypothetical protein